MQEMWGQGGAGQPSQPQKFEVFQEPPKPSFEVFQEPAKSKTPTFEIYQDPQPAKKLESKAKFEIFQDKENQIIPKPKLVISDENDVPKEPKFQKSRKSGLQAMPMGK